jgi:hypothetical protein
MANRETYFRIETPDGTGHIIAIKGRPAWALTTLLDAGEMGCTPITHPGPRWSAYIHILRHEYGLNIETHHESHGDPFPGHHARYVLRSRVYLLEGRKAA